jgi:putative aldouronate transport system permease protein
MRGSGFKGAAGMSEAVQAAAPRKIRSDIATIVLRIASYITVGLFAVLCLIPFIALVSASISSENSILLHGYSFLPREFSTFGYKLIFINPKVIMGSYVVTIILTAIGTSIGLFIVAMTGYALQRADFPYRNKISFYIYFTTLFSGGLVPFYLLIVQVLHLKDNYLSVLLPGLMSPWVIILMKSFTKSVPHSITESAKMDGAGDFRIFLSLILPKVKPALATIGFFTALYYWNEWYNSMLFLSPNMIYRPLQLYLYNIITRADFIRNSTASANIPYQDIPVETMKMATAVVANGPIIILFPFVQRFFIKGITVGAVKG